MSHILKRLTYANVAVTVALVFAMTGGAYAAKRYLITSTKQIAPQVLKQLKGASGSAGAAGAPGPQGPIGKEGAPGKDGTPGKDGLPGKDGTNGENGKEGKQGLKGEPGEPWAAGGKLPSGKTETGTWAYLGNKENGAVGSEAVSFLLALESVPKVEFLYAGQTGTNCTGNAELPTAPNGYLCVYDTLEEEFRGKPGTVTFVGVNNGETFAGLGAGKNGALLNFETVNIGTSLLPYAFAQGTWAVTAP